MRAASRAASAFFSTAKPGKAVPRGVALMVHNLHAAGLTLEEIRDEMHVALHGLVDTTLDAITKPAA